MDYMKCWMILKDSLLDRLALSEDYTTKKDIFQLILNDMASIEVSATIGAED